MTNIWSVCDAAKHVQALNGTLFRLVEGQEQIATRNVVDGLDEQLLLEQMLDDSKPDYKIADPQLHYLLKSPFRYPPLKWGSRFGNTFEPSIFYGGCSAEVTLSETAYYRYVFWFSILASEEEKGIFKSQHTMFTVGYQCDHGLKLQEPPFSEYQAMLTDPVFYQIPQQLGADMRKNEIQVFEYASARDNQHRSCVGLFTQNAFTESEPSNLQGWLCDVDEHSVIFKSIAANKLVRFPISDFLIDGKFPLSA